jgi:hypothetical protein
MAKTGDNEVQPRSVHFSTDFVIEVDGQAIYAEDNGKEVDPADVKKITLWQQP